MPLDKYKAKRDFKKSPEPTGGKPSDKHLKFVVQKHHASHLHYDFRLEIKGVLKSWAVPKGLSMNPAETRLAMLVEDHPWDYRTFEGVIPSGYGAGTVIVWDEGEYSTDKIDAKDKKSQEHSIMSQFYKGAIHFTLKGHKLKGAFTIVRANDKGENSWYVRKTKDKYASTNDVAKNERSIFSHKTLEEVAENPDRKWESHKPNKEDWDEGPDGKNSKKLISLVMEGKKDGKPKEVLPMTCTLIKQPFNKPDWLFELKLDGYRIIADHSKKSSILFSRSRLNYSKRYPEILAALKNIDHDVILDGEAVVLDNDGRPNFDLLQKYKGKETLVYYIFDVLWIDGYNVMHLPLEERKLILKKIIPENEVIKYTEHFENGTELFANVKKLGLEGMVAKKKKSIYQQGKRSKDWLKVPIEIRQEFVIGGWTESDSPRSFRSLVFGAFNNKKEFIYIGHAGGGFKEQEMASILSKLKKIETKKSAFKNKVDADHPVHYVVPELVANFKFATWTAGGKIRKPAIFQGFRDDKKPTDVIVEIPLTHNEEVKALQSERSVKKEKEHGIKNSNSADKKDKNNWDIVKEEKITSEDLFEIDGQPLKLSNIEKELWKGVTKADLIKYYHSIAPYIIPYLTNRTQSLHIKQIRATVPGFYIKDMEGNEPKWADTYSIKRKHKKNNRRNVIDYFVCNNEASLLYMVNIGCIDINPGTSSIKNYLEPDYVVIDLDPSDDDFSKVIRTALAAKKVFDELKLEAFPKTSGKTGMHLFIPCQGFSFSEAREIAIKIASKICSLEEEIATVENFISKRGNKLFIDFNQNDEADTVAAPYSVRPAKKPTVSTPLLWTEINENLHTENFDIYTILERVEKKGDLFKGVFDKSIRKKNTIQLKKILLE